MSSRFTLLLITVLTVFISLPAHGSRQPTVEAKITGFVREIYPERDEVRVRVNSMPAGLRGDVKVKNISFVKIPDVNGDGVCAVEIETAPGRMRTFQVPFRVFSKRHLFLTRQAGQRGDVIGASDLYVRETYTHGKSPDHPPTIEDVLGKTLKRDVPANTVITTQLLEERVMIRPGEIVNVIAENTKILVRTRARAVERGRLGDTMRVRNIASGKELTGTVVGSNTVKVEF